MTLKLKMIHIINRLLNTHNDTETENDTYNK